MPAGNGLIFPPAGLVVGRGMGVPSVSVPLLTVYRRIRLLPPPLA
jgi:hypothetical protein